MKKRVLHFITGLEVGGAETFLLRILPHLQKDVDNRVACLLGRGPIGKQLEAAGVPVTYLELRGVLDFGIISRYRQLIRTFKPDIQVNYLIHADIFGRIFGKLFGIPRILSSQRGSLENWEFLRSVDRLTSGLVDRYLFQTEAAYKEISQKLGLPRSKMTVIPNAINTELYSKPVDTAKLRQELGLTETQRVVLYVGRLRPGKGIEYLLKAFESIHSQQPNATLLIVGEGDHGPTLKGIIENYRSKAAIHFLGKRGDVRELLAISDIFVLPTLGEGMSNAIMEAMAAGIPIVTTDIPQNKELVAETALLVPIKDSSRIATAVNNLLSDPKQAKKLGEAAAERIATNFSIGAVQKKLHDLFLTVSP